MTSVERSGQSGGYIPRWSNGPEPEFTSHEAFCILNATDREASVEVTIYYSDRGQGLKVPARRTRHIRFNDLNDPEPIAEGTSYASIIQSDT
jgi:hypothetical protein